jgi:hypothetical protein
MIECLIIRKEYIAAINDISTIELYNCCQAYGDGIIMEKADADR